MNALARLRRFAARRPDMERCGLCGQALPEHHPHLVEPPLGKPRCACEACAAVLARESGRFRRVHERVEALPELRLGDPARAALGVPVAVAFFRAGPPPLAVYPSPLGPVESPVPTDAWESLLASVPALRSTSAVDALLVRREESFRVPIDAAYRLIGVLRREWRGFTGGDAAQAALDAFFADLRRRAGGEA